MTAKQTKRQRIIEQRQAIRRLCSRLYRGRDITRYQRDYRRLIGSALT